LKIKQSFQAAPDIWWSGFFVTEKPAPGNGFGILKRAVSPKDKTALRG
jgi:hypothetical protein